MYTAATKYQLQRHLGYDSTDSSDDDHLLDVLEAATRTLERQTGRLFLPHRQTRAHTVDTENRAELQLNGDLQSLVSITNGDGTTLATSHIKQLQSGLIQLLNGVEFVYEDTPDDAIQITGVWGYHPDADAAWRDSGDTVQANPLAASTTSLSVSDIDAGLEPTFQVGQVIALDDEYCIVTAIDLDLNSITVERGALGTTAASHTQGTSILIYDVPHDLVQATLQLAALLYRAADDPLTIVTDSAVDIVRGLRRITV